MAPPAGLRQVDLTPADAGDGLALSTRIGWNQALPDWIYMLAAGEGVGLRADGGTLVASAMALPYGRFSWICMVLVDPDYRRQGLATTLMDTVVSRQEAAGRVPGLDATPDGREVYRQIGFEEDYRSGRYRAEQVDLNAVDARETPGVVVRPLQESDLPAIVAMDAAVFGGDRSALLKHLLPRVTGAPHSAWRDGELAGYVFAREGREAHQVGPLVAESADVAIALARAALAGIEGPVYLDAPDAHTTFLDGLAAVGFAQQRPFFRMYRGRAKGFDDPACVFALAGPEFG